MIRTKGEHRDVAASGRLTRRGFLRAISTLGGVGLAGAAGVAYAYEVEPRWLALEELTVKLAGLPPTFEGLRIGQLSDLHRGPTTGKEEIAAAVQLINGLSPDLIVLTGDYVSRSAAYARELVPLLAPLRAPLGVFGVLGNHDHWTDPTLIADCLYSASIKLLRNSGSAISMGGETLWLAGVEGIWDAHDDLGAALRGAPVGAPVILLAHEPDYADTAARSAVALQLSGHSHGGQVRLPGVGAPIVPYLARKYPYGLYQVGEHTQVYTNRGVGTHPLGMRVNCRPEVTLITLASELA